MNLLDKIFRELILSMAEAIKEEDSWMEKKIDYRIVEEDGFFSIRAVIYDENGQIESYEEEDAYPIGSSLDNLIDEFELMADALTKPVISVKTEN